MIIVEGHVRLGDPGDFERLRPHAEAQVSASCAEDGCLEYTYAIDVLDPCLMRVAERWQSWDALETHFKAPHMSAWREALSGVTIIERDIRAHQVTDSKTI